MEGKGGEGKWSKKEEGKKEVERKVNGRSFWDDLHFRKYTSSFFRHIPLYSTFFPFLRIERYCLSMCVHSFREKNDRERRMNLLHIKRREWRTNRWAFRGNCAKERCDSVLSLSSISSRFPFFLPQEEEREWMWRNVNWMVLRYTTSYSLSSTLGSTSFFFLSSPLSSLSSSPPPTSFQVWYHQRLAFPFHPPFSRVNFHQSLIPNSELVRLLNESRVKWMIWMENEWVKLERLGERFLSLFFLPFSLFSLSSFFPSSPSYLNPHPLQNPPCMSCRIKTV